MLTILLISAGRTEYDCQERIQGTLDVPLSREGREQVRAGAETLASQHAQIDALYVGPCRSVQETADILAELLELKPKTLDKLHNLNHGLWQGMLFEEVKAKQPKVYRQWQERPETVCPPEGETLQEAQERLKKGLARITKKHKSGTIALVLAQPLAGIMRGLLRQEHESPEVCLAECPTASLWEAIELPAGAR